MEAKVPDPTAYELLYQVMNDRCQTILEKEKNTKIFISTTSGTPQMATIWVLSNKSGFVPGELLQVRDAKYSRGGKTSYRQMRQWEWHTS